MPITIVLGNAEYCVMLLSLAAAIAVKSASGVWNDAACKARIESLEQAVRSLKEIPRPNPSGRMLEPEERASDLQPLTSSSTPTLQAWQSAETVTLSPFRPKLATNDHSEKLAELAKHLKARSSTMKTGAVHEDSDTDSATAQLPYEKQEHCAFLTKLPLELRKMVYEHLLVCGEIITPDRQVLGEGRRMYLELNGVDYTPAKGLDATILQSCEAIYHEAYPILYGQNVFEFQDAYDISGFKSRGIKSIHCMSFFSLSFTRSRAPSVVVSDALAPTGANLLCQSCRSLVITQLTDCADPEVRNSRFRVNSIIDPIGRLSRIRHISYDMSRATQRFSSLAERWKGALEEGLSFPAIETLQLDFRGWELMDRGNQRLVS